MDIDIDTEVIIGTDHLRVYGDAWDLEDDSTAYVDRRLLLDTGRACEMLADAFSKLPNLQKVGLRDYDGQGRTREGDGPNARWRSYGWSYGLGNSERQEWLKNNPHNHSRRTIVGEADPLLPVVLHALGKALSAPKNLEIFLRR
jgi:hypothetical protein